MTRITKIASGALVALLLIDNAWSLEIKSATEAVNIAGKQRMYTQRLLKDYAMVGMGNTFGDPKKDMDETINAFDDHLKSLQIYANGEAAKAILKEVQTVWGELKKELVAKPDISRAGILQEKLETLLKASDKATKAFVKVSGKRDGEVIDIAGRQRMLSQRMASLYMLKVWGVNDQKFKEKLDETLKLFKASHQKIEEASINTDESKKLLAKVKRSFMYFEMMNRSKSKYVPSLIYKKSNDILGNMDAVTQIYVAQESK